MKALALFIIIGMCLLSVRIFYIAYFKSGETATLSHADMETYGTQKGLIFDRNMKPLVETQYTKQSSVSNNSLVFFVPLRYSENQLCAHLIGYADNEGKGMCGIEADYEDVLRAFENKISVKTFRDAQGRLLKGKGSAIDTSAQCKDNGVVLSIDKEIQEAVERNAATIEKGAAVVLDAASGEILGCASFPTFSPYHLGDAMHDKNLPFINRALMNYNVGSVFKAVVCMAALENGIDIGFQYTCTGKTYVNSICFHCHKTQGHGTLNMKQALALSCNTYFIKLAQKTGYEKIYDMCLRLRLNRSQKLSETIAVPACNLPEKNSLKNLAVLANFSFGQGQLSASPVQIANVYSVVANGGYMADNSLVLGIANNGSYQTKPPQKTRVISAKTAALLDSFLRATVTEGTGKSAASQSINIAGKTATAQTGIIEKKKEKLISYFVGYISIKSDKYTILVMKEGGTSGSVDCAPIVKRIAEIIQKIKQ